MMVGFGSRGLTFMQNNALIHKGQKNNQNGMMKTGIEVIDFGLPYSPDLNPIEHA